MHRLGGVKRKQARASGAGSDRSKRPGKVPAAIVVRRRSLANTNAGFKAGGISGNQRAPVDAAAIPLIDDGRTHDVQIVLGGQPQRPRDVQRLTVTAAQA